MSQLTVDLPSHVTADEARLLLSIKLYEAECLSLRKAAELAGCSNRAFTELLSEEGVSKINVSPEDLNREEENLNNRERLQGSVKRYDRPTEPVAQTEWDTLRGLFSTRTSGREPNLRVRPSRSCVAR